VLIAEGQHDGAGHRTAAELAGVAPVVMIEPAAVARCMQHVQLVLCAAHVRQKRVHPIYIYIYMYIYIYTYTYIYIYIYI